MISDVECRISNVVEVIFNSTRFCLHPQSEINNSKSKNTMDKSELEKRTKEFALRIIALVSALPRNKPCDVIGYQLMKSGTSIGANYREATRAESKADFIHKIGIVEKEANETLYWLELLIDSGQIPENKLTWLRKECEELLAIFTATGKTAKRRR